MDGIPHTACCAPGCVAKAVAAAAVPLCPRHLALAVETAAAPDGAAGATAVGATAVGVEDLLPAPCAACGSRLGVRYPSGWICGVCEWRWGEMPDADLTPVRVDVVYYIRFDERIKIGTSSNPRVRLSRLWHQELMAFERGDRIVERRRHEQFRSTRFPGSEWFHRTPELDAHVAAVAAGHPDPWALYARWLSEATALRG